MDRTIAEGPAPGRGHEETPIPKLQQLMESIPFLLVIGLVMPTIVYTAWSIYELVELPHFSDVAAHAAPHGAHGIGAAVGAEPATEGGVVAGTAVAADAVHVSMRSMAYSPNSIVIEPGTTVTWTNDDPLDHAVAHGTPDMPVSEKLFYSGDYPSGSSFSYTFTEPGTYDVYCSTIGHYAAGMTMTVVVEE